MRVTVHIPDDVGAEAEAYAEQEGKSVSHFYAEAVEAAVRRRKHQEAHRRITELAGTVDAGDYPREEFERTQAELRQDDPDR